jgi:hypothetical protein
MEKTQSQVKELNLTLKRRISARKEFQEQSRLRRNYERKFQKKLNNYFKDFYNQYANNYENGFTYDGLIRDEQNKLFQLFAQHYQTVIRAFGTRMLEVLRKDEEKFETIYRDYLKENSGTKIVGIVETTRRYIEKIIALNLDENLGIPLIAQEIRRLDKASFTKYRSATIARTETHNAASYANQKIVESMAIPNMQKQWMTTQDERSRDIHRAVNGTKVPLDEDFIVGGVPMSYPGDPKGGAKNVINCRCVLLYVTDDDDLQ